MRVATILKGYPRLSETFIAQEILELEKRGIAQIIVSLRHPTDPCEHDLHREIKAERLYLPEYLKDEPERLARARQAAKRLPGYQAAHEAFTADLAADASANRRRRFGQACVLATELPADIGWMHCHFLHTPASVARYASLMTGIPWSFSAHAKDIWTTPPAELSAKLASARWGVTCTGVNAAYLKGLTDTPEKVSLVYHGLDLRRFPDRPCEHPARERITLLTVGRAVEKKGFSDLLRALARLRADPRWRLVHIGGGGLMRRLSAEAERLGIAERVSFRGAQPREAVFEALKEADIFVLPSRIAASGDRDGLPNVLLEAAAFALPIIATKVSAIPELVREEETGRLVPERDPKRLAAAIAALMDDPPARKRLGLAAFARLQADFSCEPGIDLLADKLKRSLAER